MIDHVTIPVSDLERSKYFYEQAFLPLGYKVSFGEAPYFWAFDIGQGLFEIARHEGSNPITSFHIAFRVKSHEDVRAFYQAAMKAGAKDNGEPGPRPQYTKNYYACFVLDPDGHNIEAVFDTWNDHG